MNGSYAGCIPHIVHVSQLDNDIILVLLVEYGNLQVSSGLYDVFFAMHKTRILQMQNDVDGLRPAFDKLESSVKHAVEALKKAKFNSTDIDNTTKKFVSRWDVLRKKYLDLFKNCDKDLVVTIESNLPGFVEALKELFRVIQSIFLFFCSRLKTFFSFRSLASNVTPLRMVSKESQKFHRWWKDDYWNLVNFYSSNLNRTSPWDHILLNFFFFFNIKI